MPTRPEVIVFDVNQTLSDLEPLRERLTRVGAPGHLLDTWFAATLRDGFALTAAGTSATFPDIGAGVLRGLLHNLPGLTADVDEVVQGLLDGFSTLKLHPDVVPGMRLLHDEGLRLVTLTNGSAAVAEKLFDAAGVADLVERRLSVDDVGRWKPAASAYQYAAEQCGLRIDRMAMVAVHPWDIDGAARAKMTTGWLDRTGAPFPGVFSRPDVTGPDLSAVARGLLALPA